MRLAALPGALALVIAVALGGCGDRSEAPSSDHPTKPSRRPAADDGGPVQCPVCGLRFEAREARGTASHGGVTYHFLLEDHRQAFEADPTRYLRVDAGASSP